MWNLRLSLRCNRRKEVTHKEVTPHPQGGNPQGGTPQEFEDLIPPLPVQPQVPMTLEESELYAQTQFYDRMRTFTPRIVNVGESLLASRRKNFDQYMDIYNEACRNFAELTAQLRERGADAGVTRRVLLNSLDVLRSEYHFHVNSILNQQPRPTSSPDILFLQDWPNGYEDTETAGETFREASRGTSRGTSGAAAGAGADLRTQFH